MGTVIAFSKSSKLQLEDRGQGRLGGYPHIFLRLVKTSQGQSKYKHITFQSNKTWMQTLSRLKSDYHETHRRINTKIHRLLH